MASALNYTYILSLIGSEDLPICDVRGAGLFIHKQCVNAFVRKFNGKLAEQMVSEDTSSPSRPSDEFFEAIAIQKVANYMSEATLNSLSTIKFKALDMEKEFLRILSTHGISKATHISRFILNLEKNCLIYSLEKTLEMYLVYLYLVASKTEFLKTVMQIQCFKHYKRQLKFSVSH